MNDDMNDEHPYITHDGKKYWQVGCTKCENGSWNIYTRDGALYVAICKKCGHTTEMGPPSLKLMPDRMEKKGEMKI